MAISPFVRPFGIASAILGIIQGLVWSCLSLLAILIHITAWNPKPDISTYGGLLSEIIVKGYLNGAAYKNLYIVPRLFFVWTILYFIASLFWVGLSTYQLGAVLQDNKKLLKKAYLGWSSWTLILCICDLILTSLLASDYNTLVQAVNLVTNPSKEDYTIILACGIVMTLTARGFILWIVNLTFSIIVMKLSIDLPKKITENDSLTINAYGNSTSGNWDPNKHTFTRSDSVVSSKSFGTFHGLPRLPPVQSTNQPLARLARTNSTRSLSNATRPLSNGSYLYASSPSISNPNNYSGSNNSLQPTLKSALKQRT